MQAVGAVLRRRREALGVSQEALGLATGRDRGYVSHIELGQRNIGVLTLRALTDGLGVPLSEVLVEAERIHAKSPDIESPRVGPGRRRQPGGAKNSRAMLSGSRKDRPDP